MHHVVPANICNKRSNHRLTITKVFFGKAARSFWSNQVDDVQSILKRKWRLVEEIEDVESVEEDSQNGWQSVFLPCFAFARGMFGGFCIVGWGIFRGGSGWIGRTASEMSISGVTLDIR